MAEHLSKGPEGYFHDTRKRLYRGHVIMVGASPCGCPVIRERFRFAATCRRGFFEGGRPSNIGHIIAINGPNSFFAVAGAHLIDRRIILMRFPLENSLFTITGKLLPCRSTSLPIAALFDELSGVKGCREGTGERTMRKYTTK